MHMCACVRVQDEFSVDLKAKGKSNLPGEVVDRLQKTYNQVVILTNTVMKPPTPGTAKHTNVFLRVVAIGRCVGVSVVHVARIPSPTPSSQPSHSALVDSLVGGLRSEWNVAPTATATATFSVRTIQWTSSGDGSVHCYLGCTARLEGELAFAAAPGVCVCVVFGISRLACACAVQVSSNPRRAARG